MARSHGRRTLLMAVLLGALLAGEVVADRKGGKGGKGKGKGKDKDKDKGKGKDKDKGPHSKKFDKGGKGKDKNKGRKDVGVLCTPGSFPGDCAFCSRGRCTGCVPATVDSRGIYLDKRGACSPCPDAFCRQCYGGDGKCRSCLPGYGLAGKRCVPCSGPLLILSRRGECKCIEGYEWDKEAGECLAEIEEPEDSLDDDSDDDDDDSDALNNGYESPDDDDSDKDDSDDDDDFLG